MPPYYIDQPLVWLVLLAAAYILLLVAAVAKRLRAKYPREPLLGEGPTAEEFFGHQMKRCHQLLTIIGAGLVTWDGIASGILLTGAKWLSQALYRLHRYSDRIFAWPWNLVGGAITTLGEAVQTLFALGKGREDTNDTTHSL